METGKLLLTPREAAKALSVCEKTLWTWTQPRGPIPAVRFGSAVRYSVAALSRFIAAAESGALEGAGKPVEDDAQICVSQPDESEYGILPAVEFPARQGAS